MYDSSQCKIEEGCFIWTTPSTWAITEWYQKSSRGLLDKHPPSQPIDTQPITNAEPPDDIHRPVVFEALDSSAIKSAALHINGAAGPSGLDALSWRRLCISFKTASHELCHSPALSARRRCTDLVDPACIAPLLACRLIALTKTLGFARLVLGILLRIMAKAILSVTKQDLQEAAGPMQLCAGQIGGIEAGSGATRRAVRTRGAGGATAPLLFRLTDCFNFHLFSYNYCQHAKKCYL